MQHAETKCLLVDVAVQLDAGQAGDLFIAGRMILASGGRSAIYKQAALVAIRSFYQNS